MDDDRFWVKSLTLENFRCFEKTELGPFDPHFNLLVGANGTGKSSVLLALASLFRQLAEKGGLRHAGLLGNWDARQPPVYRQLRIGAEISWRNDDIVLREDFGETLASFSKISINSDSEDMLSNGLLSDNFFPRTELLVFYDVRRHFRNLRPNRNFEITDRRFLAYTDWQDAGVSSEHLRDWLKDQTLFALQSEDRIRRGIGEPGETPARRQLTLVQGALAKALEGASHIEVDGELNDIVVEFKNAPRQQFAQMSDGQRALIGMVADIVRRACLLNFERFGSETLERTTGLVLIDEIDLHLHPKWQRRIVGALKEIFPKIQFFATTHSPQVIGECQPNEIVLLTEDGKQERPSRSFGMDSRWVLECIMRAEGRDPGTAARIAEMFRALDEGRFDDAKRAVEDLRETIGDDRDVAAVDAYLWNLGHEGEEAAE